MAGGLFALLDDVAALARMAAASVDDVAAAAGKASTQAVGVVVDDTAVTPRYVQGLAAERELPIIAKIAKGSIRNKLLIILPVILVLSQFLPIAVTILLILGGLYLSYEGAEKIHHALAHRRAHREETPAEHLAEDVATESVDENKVIAEAVRTDLILSTEIMVISLQTVDHEPFLTRTIVLIVVAFLITALVYGVVALIVKMYDVGLHLVESGKNEKLGRGLVTAMPKVMSFLSTLGVVAMLWVGGHILLANSAELGWRAPYDAVHHVEHAVADATGALGGVLAWLTNTLISAIVGVLVGLVLVALVTPVLARRSGEVAAAH